MNITLSKVKRTLLKDYGWENLDDFIIDQLLKNTLKIVDNQLKAHKGISIKNK